MPSAALATHAELTPHDQAQVLALVADAAASDGVRPLSERFRLGLADAAPQAPHLLAHCGVGELTAYGRVLADGQAELVVAPAHRRRGIGTALQGMTQRSAPAAAGTISTRPRPAPGNADEPIDSDLAAQFSARRARIAALSTEGQRQLRAGNPRRAMELCRAWTDLELANADAWRCLGQAAQAAGAHQEAVNAFRKAKQFDPADQTLDGAIERSQQGIVADFLRRNRP